MATDRELVMYGRSAYCPYQSIAKRVLTEHQVPYRLIGIDQDPEARRRVIEWTGFESVPTLVVARPGEDLPYEEPAPLERGASPKGIDRGSMLTEPGEEALIQWLRKQGFIA